MPECKTHWLIVTDLDGTLLDDGYDLESAAAAVDRQTEQGRSVALASSKTLDEMLVLARLCRRPPVLLFENGAGEAWPVAEARGDRLPAYRTRIAGTGYRPLRARLRALRRRRGYRFLGFGDLSAREVAQLTGLTADAARLARHRAASEPLLWLDSAERLSTFRISVEEGGFRLVAGGRFQHVMPRADKAHGLRAVARRLGERATRVRVLACGDADNDLAMLRAADRALVFPRRGGGHMEVCNDAGVDVGVRVDAQGARAWSDAIDNTLSTACREEPAS